MNLRNEKMIAKAAGQLSEQLEGLEAFGPRMVKQLQQGSRRDAGLAWTIPLLALGAYALYRTGPGLLKRASELINGPGSAAQDHPALAGPASLSGPDPVESAKAAVDEVKRAEERRAETAKDQFAPLQPAGSSGPEALSRAESVAAVVPTPLQGTDPLGSAQAAVDQAKQAEEQRAQAAAQLTDDTKPRNTGSDQLK